VRQTRAVAQVLCPVVVGREVEVRALESALDGALAARGGCVVITGEAGIGKSRLVSELVRMAARRGVMVVSGRAVPASTTTAYRPVTEALLELLRSRPVPDDPSLGPWLWHLAALVPGVLAAGALAESVSMADADTIRGEAVLRLLGRVSPEGLVVAFEDMHWADPDTVALLEYLADNADGQPLLFVMSLRAEPPSPAAHLVRRQRGRPGVLHLALDRLSEREVADMIALCRPDADAAECLRIVRASDGVPLLVEELEPPWIHRRL